MNTSRLLIAAACSLTFVASSVAFAGTTLPDASNSGVQDQNQYQNQDQNSDNPSSTSATGSTNSTTSDSDSTRGTDATGTRMGLSTDDSMRNADDGSTMRRERLARTDRN